MSNMINNRMSIDEIWEVLLEYQDDRNELSDIIADANLPTSKLKALMKGNDELTDEGLRGVIYGIEKSSNTTEQMLWDIIKSDDTPYEVLPLVLENPHATHKMCEELIDLEDENIQIQIMTYDRFVDTWCDLADSGCSKWVRGEAEEILEDMGYWDEEEDDKRILSSDENIKKKREIAKNPNTPINELKMLAKDDCWEVRYFVARNPSTPIEVLKMLAKDRDNWIRWNIACNPNTPVEALEMLANDGNEDVRSEVAKNPNTPIEVLRKLIGDESKYGKSVMRRSNNHA